MCSMSCTPQYCLTLNRKWNKVMVQIQNRLLWYHNKLSYVPTSKMIGNKEFNHLTIIPTILKITITFVVLTHPYKFSTLRKQAFQGRKIKCLHTYSQYINIPIFSLFSHYKWRNNIHHITCNQCDGRGHNGKVIKKKCLWLFILD
jgi:hypothetical protein